MITALSGTSDRAEHHHQQQERDEQHAAEEERQPVGDAPRGVEVRGHHAADGDGETGVGGGRRGWRRRAAVSTRSSVAASWGDVVGTSGQYRGVARVVDDGRGDVGDAADLGELRPRAASAAPAARCRTPLGR